MEIKVLHGNDLAVAPSGSAALDAKCGALARLSNAGENLFAEMRADGLAQADRRGGLPFSERRGRDGGDHDVLAVRDIAQPVADREAHLGLALAVEFQLLGSDADFGGNAFDRDG